MYNLNVRNDGQADSIDLGVTELKVVELVMDLEDECSIAITDEEREWMTILQISIDLILQNQRNCEGSFGGTQNEKVQ